MAGNENVVIILLSSISYHRLFKMPGTFGSGLSFRATSSAVLHVYRVYAQEH